MFPIDYYDLNWNALQEPIGEPIVVKRKIFIQCVECKGIKRRIRHAQPCIHIKHTMHIVWYTYNNNIWNSNLNFDWRFVRVIYKNFFNKTHKLLSWLQTPNKKKPQQPHTGKWTKKVLNVSLRARDPYKNELNIWLQRNEWRKKK